MLAVGELPASLDGDDDEVGAGGGASDEDEEGAALDAGGELVSLPVAVLEHAASTPTRTKVPSTDIEAHEPIRKDMMDLSEAQIPLRRSELASQRACVARVDASLGALFTWRDGRIEIAPTTIGPIVVSDASAAGAGAKQSRRLSTGGRLRTMTARRGTGWLFALAAGLALTVIGCADDSEEPQGPSSGEQVVRGVLGAGPDAKGAQAKAADAIVAKIQEQHPGRIDQLEKDLKSRDGRRVRDAKRLLDETIRGAKNTFGGAGTSLTTSSVRFLDGPVDLTPGGDDQIVDAEDVELVCGVPRDAAGQEIHLGRAADGRYGDDRVGQEGAYADDADLLAFGVPSVVLLALIDDGEYQPDPDSRLGAYAATRGYPEGTVGYAVHNAIGTIADLLGTYGQERIGRVFNSPEARALYDEPVASCAGYRMAVLEYTYWKDVLAEDPFSIGGSLGSMFDPAARDLLQRNIFN